MPRPRAPREPNGPPAPSEVWFEPSPVDVKDMGFPAGRIKVMCRVRDGLDASTDTLADYINVSSAEVVVAGGLRRLLAAGDFFAKAKGKLASALKTFRVDKVNQLANSVASHADGGGLGPADSKAKKVSSYHIPDTCRQSW